MERYAMDGVPSTGNAQASYMPPADDLVWIIFKSGACEARIPIEDEPADATWRYVLDVTSMGFRADRIGDTIVITGRPSDMEVLPS